MKSKVSDSSLFTLHSSLSRTLHSSLNPWEGVGLLQRIISVIITSTAATATSRVSILLRILTSPLKPVNRSRLHGTRSDRLVSVASHLRYEPYADALDLFSTDLLLLLNTLLLCIDVIAEAAQSIKFHTASFSHEGTHHVSQLAKNIGISQYAVDELGEIEYIELPVEDEDVIVGEDIGLLESSNNSQSIYAPISGTIIAVNEELVPLKCKPSWGLLPPNESQIFVKPLTSN